MFDVSFTELMVIGVIALIVIGPERLPKVARTVGHLLGRAQRYVSDVKSDIRREIELDELRKFKDQMQEAADSVQSSLRDTGASLRETGASLRAPLDELSRSISDPLTAPAKEAEKNAKHDADADFPPLTTPPVDHDEPVPPAAPLAAEEQPAFAVPVVEPTQPASPVPAPASAPAPAPTAEPTPKPDEQPAAEPQSEPRKPS